MKDILKLAWRNLWRNRRRTLITAASIFFAIFFAIGMRSFQLGSYDHMIKQVIEAYTGYLQVQQSDYLDDPGIDNVFEAKPELLKQLEADPNVKVAVPRIESFALASTGTLSKGVMVTGIAPDKEGKLSGLGRQKLIKGRNLGADDTGILLSERLSKYLKAGIGDTVVLMGQGYHGVSAADVFPVRGIVRLPSPDLDNKLIYMTISTASTFFSLSNQLTAIAINLNNTDGMKRTQKRLTKLINDNRLSVKNWEELNPVLKQQIEQDNKSGQIFLAVLYLIIFFGIFGTVQMMISERQHEFGMMVAIGMKRKKLAEIILVEMLMLGFLGAISGMMAIVPFILWGYYDPLTMTGEMARMYTDIGFDPVMPMAWFDGYFFRQAGVIFLMVLLASWLPVRSILKLNVIKALHGQ